MCMVLLVAQQFANINDVYLCSNGTESFLSISKLIIFIHTNIPVNQYHLTHSSTLGTHTPV